MRFTSPTARAAFLAAFTGTAARRAALFTSLTGFAAIATTLTTTAVTTTK
jgi:hypothetical protein